MRKICVVTGTRADYGLLSSVMIELKSYLDVELQIVVTGAHLSSSFGDTWKDISRDGFSISMKVEMLELNDTPAAIAKSMGRGTIGMADAMERLAPDFIVILGDRYESLSAAQTAMVMRIPIAHIHGGETTVGAIDEAIRHSVTKMSHLHYVATETYRHRVIQLGEDPDRVIVVGALGLDSIAKLEHMTRAELENHLNLPLNSPLFLVTCHPETLSGDAGSFVDSLIEALGTFPDATIVITSTNADAGYRAMESRLKAFASANANRMQFVENLGQRRYLNLLRESDIVIGNSSSGLFEAPSLGTPTVNIGIRQKGRLRSASIIDCGAQTIAIRDAIMKALTPEFQSIAARKETPYGTPGAGGRIARHLKTVNLDGILLKNFNDLEWLPRA